MTTALIRQGGTAGQALADTHALVTPALHAAVALLPDPIRRVATYHLGWRDEFDEPTATGGGKLVRSALAVLSAQAVGGRAAEAVPAAVSAELVHNFSLLHDDVMDGDRTRRHRRTAWVVFGVPAAVLAGDALLVLALRTLADSGRPAATHAVRELSQAATALMEGQGADLDFEQREDVGLRECLRMAGDKTGALFGAACAAGALLGGGGVSQVACLRKFGRQLGLVYQLVDDLLGLWGDPAVTGKPGYSDLVNRKKSLPVAAALASGTHAAVELAELYRPGRVLTEPELALAAGLVEAAGGRAWAEHRADCELVGALSRLREAAFDPAAVACLRDLAHQMTNH